MALIRNISIDQGATYKATLTVYDDNDLILDLTNYTTYAQIRKTYSSTTFVNMNPTITDAALGAITMEITDETTATMKAGRYVYDLIIEDIDGKRTRVIEGIATVSPGVTSV